MNLYRVKYGKRTGAASWGDWKYYEDEEKMLVDLLEASLDVEYKNYSRVGGGWLRMRLAGIWSNVLYGDKDLKTTRIYDVEKVENDEWVPVQFEYTPPSVRLL